MNRVLNHIRSMAGRHRQQHLRRPGHEPGELDVRDENDAGFWANPNFFYFQALGEGRPAWLPLYPYPRMEEGTALNYFSREGLGGWPAELDPDEPLGSERDWVQVVGQYVALSAEGPGAVLNNERVLGGWLRGHYEASAVWDLVVVPSRYVNRARMVSNPVAYSKQLGGYLAWGNDLWLGNTGLREGLLVARDAAQNPPDHLC